MRKIFILESTDLVGSNHLKKCKEKYQEGNIFYLKRFELSLREWRYLFSLSLGAVFLSRNGLKSLMCSIKKDTNSG